MGFWNSAVHTSHRQTSILGSLSRTNLLKNHRQRFRLPSKYSLTQKYLSPEAESLLRSILKSNPKERLTLREIEAHPFFSKGLVLKQKFPQILAFRPLTEKEVRDLTYSVEESKNIAIQKLSTFSLELVESLRASELSRDSWILKDQKPLHQQEEIKENPFQRRSKELTYSRSRGRGEQNVVMDVVDCSKHYGICYKLSSGTVGALFNDGTNSLISSNGEEMLYKAEHGTWQVMSAIEARQTIGKKFRLMKKFKEMLGRGKENEEQDEEGEEYLSLNPKSLQPLFATQITIRKEAVRVTLSDKRLQYIRNSSKWCSFVKEYKTQNWKHLLLKKGLLYQSELFQELDMSHPLYHDWKRAMSLLEN